MIRINLIPPEYAASQSKKEQQILFGSGIGVYLVILIGFFLLKKAQAASYNEKISQAEADLRTFQAIVDQINRIEEDKRKLTAKRDVIVNLNKSRLIYPVFFEDLLPLIPSDVWVTDIRYDTGAAAGFQYRLQSKALSNYALATWLTNLEQSTHFSNIKIDRINYESGTPAAPGALAFQVSFAYKHDGPLPLSEY